MSSYIKFNNWVYNYYIDNCIPKQINSLSIPLSEIEEFLRVNEINLVDFEEIKTYSWGNLVNDEKDVALCFGLIALQCIAAFKMENKDGKTAANFKERFAELVGISDISKIETLFSEKCDENFRVQEKLWINAKLILKNSDIIINIPNITTHKGRYIQYPTSQIILNYEDLKEYNEFFLTIKNEYESIYFEDFKRIYVNNISNFKKSFNRHNNIKSEIGLSDIERKIKLKQIFDFYSSENWERSIKSKNSISNNNIENYYIKLTSQDLHLYDRTFTKIDYINSFFRKHRFMIFKQNDIYLNEYESEKFIDLLFSNIMIVYNSPSNSNEIRELNKVFSKIELKNNDINILIYKIDNDFNIPEFLRTLVSSSFPVELIGNKISNEKRYFVTSPPKLISKGNIPFFIYYNKKRVTYNEITKVGKYTIKINGYSNYNFELVELPLLEFNSNHKTSSLLFSSLDYYDDYNDKVASINGLLIKFESMINKDLFTINNWINTIKGNKIKSNSHLLKAISQYKDGKNSKNIRDSFR